jgi:hypothetical protein
MRLSRSLSESPKTELSAPRYFGKLTLIASSQNRSISDLCRHGRNGRRSYVVHDPLGVSRQMIRDYAMISTLLVGGLNIIDLSLLM